MEVVGVETRFELKKLYAEAYFDPHSAWRIENRYIKLTRYKQGFVDLPIKVTHWMPMPELPKEDEDGVD